MKRKEYLKAFGLIIGFFIVVLIVFLFYSKALNKKENLNELISFCYDDKFYLDVETQTKLMKNIDELLSPTGYWYLNFSHPLNGFRIYAKLKLLKEKLEKYRIVSSGFHDKADLLYFVVKMGELLKKIEKLNVLIYERFDTDSEGRGYYNAIDMKNSRKIVILGYPDKVRKYFDQDYHEIYLKNLGEFPYSLTYSNGYTTYNKKAYFQTYFLPENQEAIENLFESYEKQKKKYDKQKDEMEKEAAKLDNFFKQNINPLKNDILKLLGEK